MGEDFRSPTGDSTAVGRCTACVHYGISHDAAFPHACRAMGFKSSRLPMLDVLASSGQVCLHFAAKAPRRQ